MLAMLPQEFEPLPPFYLYLYNKAYYIRHIYIYIQTHIYKYIYTYIHIYVCKQARKPVDWLSAFIISIIRSNSLITSNSIIRCASVHLNAHTWQFYNTYIALLDHTPPYRIISSKGRLLLTTRGFNTIFRYESNLIKKIERKKSIIR